MSIKYEQLISQAFKNISNQRTRDILYLRFGLKDGQRQTLDTIGQKYGITRERVRQIEEVAFSDLKKPAVVSLFKPTFSLIDNFLNQEGKIIREERLLSSLTGIDQLHPDRGALFFILTLGQPYQRFVESENFYPLWSNSKNALNQAEKIINQLVKNLEQIQKPVSRNYFLTDTSLSKKAILSYLDATKQISQNNFGQFGLVKWPEINPRGAKDKAYIIIKKNGAPLHFREVSDLINQANLGTNLAQAQTVHNELIKDPRFILVGRGTYALKEWGYQSGTVKDVIIQILKENGSLAKEDILGKVLESRLVKPNTVLINLQNRQYFNKDKEGQYSLVK
ncbi:hypothetical protein KKH07_00095 [Patescibacteria group bacterium]|nr:hypothetical protein [Patescibacteria group bacterium]MBU1563715.1 hypothetical protein [Patescibacteria group bacterium]